jgi:hypothetical protein
VGVDCAKECPTDAGTAEMAAIANAKARVILVNMVFLLVFEARSGSCGLDRKTPSLFLWRNLNGACAMGVYVCFVSV